MKKNIYLENCIKLSELKVNQKCRVVKMSNDNEELRRRLLDMGITKDVVITIKRIAPLGDPVDIHLRGYDLCIRKSDMKKIDVEVISCE